MRAIDGLPPGQHAIDVFPRWGLPQFVRKRPAVPLHPQLRLGGDVRHSHDLGLDALAIAPRRNQVSDLHCVTTWTRRDIEWSGWALRDVYDAIIVPRAEPRRRVRFLVFHGLDGYRVALPIEDALARDVLLADRLDCRPLTLAHGAPLRLVAPSHYGYKSAKHLCAIECWTDLAPPPTQDWREHPRARAALEERGSFLPGWAYRAVYRAFLPLWMRFYLGPRRRLSGPPRSTGSTGEGSSRPEPM